VRQCQALTKFRQCRLQLATTLINPCWAEMGSSMPDPDHSLRMRVARLLQLASEARASGRHGVADQFTERAAEVLEQIVSDELAKSSESKRE
jgi:hypothetical protein